MIIVLAPFLREVAEREIGLRDADIGLEHSDGLAVVANRQLLSRAIGNLLRNAMRHAGESEAISLDASQDGQGKINIIVRELARRARGGSAAPARSILPAGQGKDPRTRRHRPLLVYRSKPASKLAAGASPAEMPIPGSKSR